MNTNVLVKQRPDIRRAIRTINDNFHLAIEGIGKRDGKKHIGGKKNNKFIKIGGVELF